MDLNTYGAKPGIDALQQTSEVQVWDGPIEAQVFGGGLLASTAVDSGNTPTTSLRPGLLLGQLTATGEYVAYDPTAVTGAEVARAVLTHGISTLDSGGVAVQKQCHLIAKGILRGSAVLNLDLQARRQLLASGKFIFSDEDAGKPGFLGLPLREIAKDDDYTVLASDNGTLFTTLGAAGAVVFTLPAIAQGLAFEFLNLVDQNMSIVSAAGDDIVWVDDLAADSLTFVTTDQKIGAHVLLYANAAGTKWYVRNLSPSTVTVTPTS